MTFDSGMPHYNKETEEAIKEARDIMSGKIKTKSYTSAEDLIAEVEEN